MIRLVPDVSILQRKKGLRICQDNDVSIHSMGNGTTAYISWRSEVCPLRRVGDTNAELEMNLDSHIYSTN